MTLEPDTLTKLTYQTLQQGKSYFALAHKIISNQLLKLISPPIESKTQPLPPEVIAKIQKRLDQLRDTDWQEAEQGIYPTHLLFEDPWEDFLQYYPAFCLNLRQSWERANQKQYQDFSPEIETEGYPRYYLQNFHYQTDGYLGELSANTYDVGVEILFNGAANAMRRRILAPLKQGLAKFFPHLSLNTAASRQIRILDIACGTGQTLKLIRGTFPKVSLFGTDLSPTYLKKANQLLSQSVGDLPQLLQANAEELPYRDHYFHALSCVFLFHELPASVRQKVIAEAFRVTQPGGIFVICDSIQKSDSPEFQLSMENFAAMFHEPYYLHYITDDLEQRLETAGFTQITTQIHFMSKYWIAYKPQTEGV